MKNKILTIISVIVVIIILFSARIIYSDHTLKKVMGACILAQTQTSSIEEAKQFCVDKFKWRWKKLQKMIPYRRKEKYYENKI